MSNAYILKASLVMSIVTIIFRALPFLLMKGRKTPKTIIYLGNILPYAIMGMLLIYCLKGVDIFSTYHGIPEALAIGLVVVLHKWKHNSMLSLSLATLAYMFLVQVIFI